MNAGIYFHPDGYITEGRQIMGRHAAGESFLRGYLEGTRGQEMWIQVEDPKHVPAFEKIAKRMGRNEAKAIRRRSEAPARSSRRYRKNTT